MDGFPEVGLSRGFFSPQSFLRSIDRPHHHRHHPKHRPEQSGELPENTAQVQASAAQVSQSTSADYSIVTKEGDKVTISGSSRYDLSYSTYNASGKLNGSEVSLKGESFSFSASRELNIQVEGDLSEEELRDIRKLIKGSQEIFGDFLRGDVEEAYEDTLKLGKLDSLASFEAELTFSRSVSVTQVAAQSPLTVEGDGSQPSSTSTLPSEDGAQPVPVEAKTITADSTKNFLLNITGQIKDSGIEKEKLKSPYGQLFSAIAAENGFGSAQKDSKSLLLEAIKSQVFKYLSA